MSYLFNDIAKIRIAPMSSLSLLVDTSSGSTSSNELIMFQMPEADSSWTLDPIVRPTSEAGERIVAFRLAIVGVFAYNNLEDMRPALALLTGRPLTDVGLGLAALTGQRGGARMTVSMDDTSIRVRSCSVVWNVESVEWRPRLRLSVKGIYSAEAIDVSVHGLGLFTQSAGW